MKYFIAILALVAVASARSLDNHFLPIEGQFDVHPAVDIVSGSQVSQTSGSPLVQIIVNIESNDAAAPSPVAPIVQPIIQPIDVEEIAPLPIILPIAVEGINPLPIVLPIEVPEGGQIVDTISIAEPILPGQIVDTISIAEPIIPGQIVDTISIAEPIIPGQIVDTISIAEPIIPGEIVDTISVAEPILPIGIIGIPEILN